MNNLFTTLAALCENACVPLDLSNVILRLGPGCINPNGTPYAAPAAEALLCNSSTVVFTGDMPEGMGFASCTAGSGVMAPFYASQFVGAVKPTARFADGHATNGPCFDVSGLPTAPAGPFQAYCDLDTLTIKFSGPA